MQKQCPKCGSILRKKNEFRQNRCSPCHVKLVQAWGKKYPWRRHLMNARVRCYSRKHESFHRYGGRGIKVRLSVEEVERLWIRDRAWKMKKPTLDRKNSGGHYDFDNCRFLEHVENSRLGGIARKRKRTLEAA